VIHGPDIGELREDAKSAVMGHFVRLAEAADRVPATLRAMYVRKAEQAQLVLDGGSSRLIEGEAEIRGITPQQMAQVVVDMAAAGGDELEIVRMRTNVRIETAADETAIMNILEEVGAQLYEA